MWKSDLWLLFFYLSWTMVICCLCIPLFSVLIWLIRRTIHPWDSLQTKIRTHYCQLYSRVGWPALSSRRLSHYCIFIYKAILGVLPSYLCSLMRESAGPHFLRSQDLVLLSVRNVRTEQGKKAFVYSAPTVWNTLQKGPRTCWINFVKCLFVKSWKWRKLS